MRRFRLYEKLAALPKLTNLSGTFSHFHGGAKSGDERISQNDQALQKGL